MHEANKNAHPKNIIYIPTKRGVVSLTKPFSIQCESLTKRNIHFSHRIWPYGIAKNRIKCWTIVWIEITNKKNQIEKIIFDDLLDQPISRNVWLRLYRSAQVAIWFDFRTQVWRLDLTTIDETNELIIDYANFRNELTSFLREILMHIRHDLRSFFVCSVSSIAVIWYRSTAFTDRLHAGFVSFFLFCCSASYSLLIRRPFFGSHSLLSLNGREGRI